VASHFRDVPDLAQPVTTPKSHESFCSAKKVPTIGLSGRRPLGQGLLTFWLDGIRAGSHFWLFRGANQQAARRLGFPELWVSPRRSSVHCINAPKDQWKRSSNAGTKWVFQITSDENCNPYFARTRLFCNPEQLLNHSSHE
jgi:hypothetical protein